MAENPYFEFPEHKIQWRNYKHTSPVEGVSSSFPGIASKRKINVIKYVRIIATTHLTAGLEPGAQDPCSLYQICLRQWKMSNIFL